MLKQKRLISYKMSKGNLYNGKKYNNPYFRHKPKSRLVSYLESLSWKSILVIIGTLLLAILLSWVVYLSSLFEIRKIEVRLDTSNEKTRVDTGELEALAWQLTAGKRLYFLSQKNLFLFPSHSLRDEVLRKYFLESVTISKKPLHTLKVSLAEKAYAVIWHEGEKYFLADEDGRLVLEVNPLEVSQKNYPLVDNLHDLKSQNNQVPSDINRIKIIRHIFETLRSKNMNIERFVIDNTPNTLLMKVENGPEVLFSTQNDIDDQLENLIALKEEKLKDDFNKKAKINLRFGDKIYLE